MIINEIQSIDDKDIFLHIQKKWDKVYPGLKLIVLNDKKRMVYSFTWSVNTPHIQQALGSFHFVEKDELVRHVPDTLIFKIEMLEKEFERCAIEHYLRF